MLTWFMSDSIQGIWKDMEVDVAYSWHSQGIRLEGMKKVTKIAARIIDEKAGLETGVSWREVMGKLYVPWADVSDYSVPSR